jgi:hypothetical protein
MVRESVAEQTLGGPGENLGHLAAVLAAWMISNALGLLQTGFEV